MLIALDDIDCSAYSLGRKVDLKARSCRVRTLCCIDSLF
eukprot:XP_001705718.1 Hypothetical protein GL50803_37381 [Giardia lamblia ATCC 50803]